VSRAALARTHRPRRFDELVGQDAVARTLRSAIEGDRVAHAYLFCGPRGVGKTTAARILAMALNCPSREGGEPCGECESCRRIWSGRTSLDVVEIDAASHRGVDDARDLRERAMYAPSEEDRYKVYIVDEAHMLTREAWNALLKILEEPPSRVIFAFATTEPQRIQQTAAPVMSRCQRFDFRRVSVPDIVGRLETVLSREGVDVGEGALLPIARRAEGGVRDALSLLDQVLSFSGDRIEAADVRRMLGLVDEDRYLSFFDLAARGDRAGVLPFVQELVDAGYDPAEFVRGLADGLRALLALRMDPGADVELAPEPRERFLEMAGPFEEVDLLRLLMAVSDFETSGRFRRSAQQRIQLEVLLLRLVSMDSAVELEDLLRAAGGEIPGQGRRPEGAGGGPAASGRSGAGREGSGRSGAGDAAGERPARRERSSTGVQEGRSAPRAAPSPETRGGSPSAAGGGTASATATASAPPPEASGRSLQERWRSALASIEGLTGVGLALRGTKLREAEDGGFRVQAPAGLADDLEAYLEDRRLSAPVRDALGRELGRASGDIALRVEGAGPPRRMTAEAAREQRLEELADMDPRLREAVEELDLSIKE